MKFNKSAIIPLVLLLLVIGAGFAFWNYRNTILNAPKNSQTTTAASYTITDKKITDNTKPFKIDITYPQVAGLDAYNQEIEKMVQDELSSFKTIVLENDAAMKATDPVSYAKYPVEYDFLMSYTKGEIDGDIASIMLNEEQYSGGAHGAHNFLPLNFNVKTGKDIALADMFAGQKNYVQTISDFSEKDLSKQITKAAGNLDGTYIATGAGPIADNFTIFLINKDSIVFYFPEYQVAPYSYGDFEVTFPR